MTARFHRLRGPVASATLLALSPLLLIACGGGDASTHEIASGEVVSDPEVELGADTKDRLGVRMPGPATKPPATAATEDAAPAAASSGSGGLAYALPAGWSELPPQQFRDANFQAGEGVECYVTLLGGDGGGLLANVNRWRGQVGLPPTDAAALEALPTVPMLDGEATLVELVGDAQAMTGVVRLMPGRAVFVKMTGAPEGVGRERERFLALVQSLTLGG